MNPYESPQSDAKERKPARRKASRPLIIGLIGFFVGACMVNGGTVIVAGNLAHPVTTYAGSAVAITGMIGVVVGGLSFVYYIFEESGRALWRFRNRRSR